MLGELAIRPGIDLIAYIKFDHAIAVRLFFVKGHRRGRRFYGCRPAGWLYCFFRWRDLEFFVFSCFRVCLLGGAVSSIFLTLSSNSIAATYAHSLRRPSGVVFILRALICCYHLL